MTTRPAWDPGDELAGRERLGQVIVGTELEADDPIGLLVARRQDQDCHAPAAAKLLADVEPVEIRQAEIEDDDLRVVPLDRAESAFTGLLADDLEAGAFEIGLDEPADRIVVLDDDRQAAQGLNALIASAVPWSSCTTIATSPR